jgi:hypothetical protein
MQVGEKKKMESNHLRCHAKSRRSGNQCKSWAVKGKKVCRMHGAFAGIKTKEGRERQIKAVTKHGRYTKQAIEDRKQLRQIIKESKALISQV